MKNAFTCDVEDYYQVEVFKDFISKDQWTEFPSHVEANTHKVLSILKNKGVKGTFFVLGWIAERYPALVKEIAQEGHEIASHGYAHEMISHQTQDQFREDIRKSKFILEDMTGSRVYGYRAPSFSITKKTIWALDILVEEGFYYDSSIFPIRHDLYGLPGANRFLHQIQTEHGSIWEFPPSTAKFLNFNIPVAGGGYLRLFPLSFICWGLRQVHREKQTALFYIHPWELDPAQPRIRARWTSRFRHYINLHKTEKKLKLLLEQFDFGKIIEIIHGQETDHS